MTDIDSIVLNFSPTGLLVMNAILAIVMFSVALDLKPSDFARLLRAPKPLLTGLASQFVVLPTLTFLMILVLQPSASVALGLILVAACPGGNISNFITHRAGGNAALSVSMTGCATMGAIVLTPLNIAFWGQLYTPSQEILSVVEIDPVRIAITVSLMLLLPLLAGIVLYRYRPQIAHRIRRPLQSLSMLIFLGFIVLALAANWGVFLDYARYVILIVILHNALALAGGYATASLARVSPYDRRAITIETGIQNSGLGLVLIFGFFHGMGGMAVIAALWGVWHAISGLVLAQFWSRRAAVR